MSARVLLAFALMALATPAPAGEAELARLRAEHAARFTDPLTHLRLARYHQQNGEALLAYDIVENLRRQTPEAFRAVFAEVFQVEEPALDPEAFADLLARHRAAPEDARLAERVGHQYLARGELDRAGEAFAQAAALEPDRRRHVENMGEVLNRQRLNARATELLTAWDAEHPDDARWRVDEVAAALEEKDIAKAKTLCKLALEKHPDDCELHAQRGQIFAAEGKAAEAERFLLRAVQLCPERARLHALLGSFAMLMKRDPVQALDHYLDAYFRDPNFHDGEYVDQRIAAMASQLAEAVVLAREGDCDEPACLARLLNEGNVALSRHALAKAQRVWGPELERPLLQLLGHDDPELRAGAMLLLARHADERFEGKLVALLGSIDPRRLGMGAHLAVRLQGRAGRERVAELLEHPDELVRFDALTALGLEGGPQGKAMVADHAPRERSAPLRQLAMRLGGEGS